MYYTDYVDNVYVGIIRVCVSVRYPFLDIVHVTCTQKRTEIIIANPCRQGFFFLQKRGGYKAWYNETAAAAAVALTDQISIKWPRPERNRGSPTRDGQRDNHHRIRRPPRGTLLREHTRPSCSHCIPTYYVISTMCTLIMCCNKPPRKRGCAHARRENPRSSRYRVGTRYVYIYIYVWCYGSGLISTAAYPPRRMTS